MYVDGDDTTDYGPLEDSDTATDTLADTSSYTTGDSEVATLPSLGNEC